MNKRSIRTSMTQALAQRGDAERAEQQQRYTKSSMAYAGVTAPLLREIQKEVFANYPLHDADTWHLCIKDLWENAHVRELRYTAIALLLHNRYKNIWLTTDVLPDIRAMIETGAWWDYVDNLATNAVGYLLAQDKPTMLPKLNSWAQDKNLWVRRSAILAQLKFKQDTDLSLLEHAIAGSIQDKDFFARKAIGWALRAYSRTDADWVKDFVLANKDRLSPLSKREALKFLRQKNPLLIIP